MAMHVVVVEDDPFPRLLQVILDPACEPVRVEAFRHFLSLDLADFDGWLARAPKLQAVQKYGKVLRNIDTAACAGARTSPVPNTR